MFETGVESYVHGTITVDVYFPIDKKGTPHVYCGLCKYFSRSTGRCNITSDVIPWPDRYIGVNCPANFEEET